MLLCSTCHKWIHADKVLDRFLKSRSATPNDVRRRIVTCAIVRNFGGVQRLERHRNGLERSYADERAKLESRQPLREVRRPRKRWQDYKPDLVYT
jgi:hypothetical protein